LIIPIIKVLPLLAIVGFITGCQKSPENVPPEFAVYQSILNERCRFYDVVNSYKRQSEKTNDIQVQSVNKDGKVIKVSFALKGLMWTAYFNHDDELVKCASGNA